MGLETIKDQILRENWRKFINKTHVELANAKIDHIEFKEFKDNGSYGKAKTGVIATKWVFAEKSSNSRVELELTPRTSKGIEYSQSELYEFIKSKYKITNQKISKSSYAVHTKNQWS